MTISHNKIALISKTEHRDQKGDDKILNLKFLIANKNSSYFKVYM